MAWNVDSAASNTCEPATVWGDLSGIVRRAARKPGNTRIPGVEHGGGWGIRTPEGFHPTRFPSVRHRPLGESSGRSGPAGDLEHPTRRVPRTDERPPVDC